MKYNTPYNEFTDDPSLREQAAAESRKFIDQETQFHLGGMPTEQAHPYTLDFSATVQADSAEGIRMLQSVDQDLPPVARRIFLSPEYDALVAAFLRVIKDANRVCFSGCGSTGRLSIMLEEMWRGFWEDRAGVPPGSAEVKELTAGPLEHARRACSIMTGGDRALISSVEGFEDYERFGARQVADLDLQAGDLLVAISEGGETSSVIGTALEGVKRGCQVFFVYNNPTSILVESIERSRRLITNDKVTVIDLFSGQMALSGSTRMQATTLEMLVVGAAMEEALSCAVNGPVPARLQNADRFGRLLASFQDSRNRQILGAVAEEEASVYSHGGRVTYFTSRYLLDIFCDTTERTPTFMLPPFRRFDDTSSPVSWAYAKDPTAASEAAWFCMLRREPRGIFWNSSDYSEMDAPASLVENPPVLDNREIAKYVIGSEDDPSRYKGTSFLYISFLAGDDQEADLCQALPGCTGECHRTLTLIRDDDEVRHSGTSEGDWVVKLYLPESPIKLWRHLAVKLLFNTVSTASMGIMGRIRNNWMIQVDCTNKKLVDRGSRIVAEVAGLSYDEGCFELHLSLLAKAKAFEQGISSTTSPVVAALERLGVD